MPIILLALLGATICLNATAQASSLVYVSKDNVWLANPDGSGTYQVTLDGSASDPYRYASQAADGTIVAVHGSGANAQIVRMSQNGTLLNAPFTTAVPGTGPLDSLVSADGSKVTYWGVTAYSSCYGLCYGLGRTYQVSYASHYVDPSTFNPQWSEWPSYMNPAWLGNSRNMLFTNSGTVWVYDLGATQSEVNNFAWPSEPFKWFQDNPSAGYPGDNMDGGYPDISFEEGAASLDGKRLAIIIANSNPGQDQYQIMIYSTAGDLASGQPPQAPTLARCYILPPSGTSGGIDNNYPGSGPIAHGLSWSPDDTSLAYDYAGAIYVAKFSSLTDCSQDSIMQVVASSADPSWGPANVDPLPRAQPVCSVPGVVGRKLAAARTAISKAHCTVGKVTRRHSSRRRSGRVLSQSRSPGSRLAAGTAINLVVGRT